MDLELTTRITFLTRSCRQSRKLVRINEIEKKQPCQILYVFEGQHLAKQPRDKPSPDPTVLFVHGFPPVFPIFSKLSWFPTLNPINR